MKMKMNSKQSGFTLVELIVVIIILAILGAVALPKFIDVTERAQVSAVKGAAGGLGAGVALFHAQWVANGHTDAVDNVDGFGGAGATFTVDSNASGWPDGTTDAGGSCVEIWDGVLQGAPPVAAAYAAGIDYVASGAVTGTCTYTYHGGQSTPPTFDHDDNAGTAKLEATIEYDTTDGSVEIVYATP